MITTPSKGGNYHDARHHEGIFAVEWNGVEIQIEGLSPTEAKASHGVEPEIEEPGVACGIDPAAVLGQESTLGCAVEPGKESEPFIEDIAHHMGVASIAEEFQGQKRAHGMTGRYHLGSRESSFLHQLVEGNLGQIRQEKEKAPEPGPQPAGRKVELAHIGNGSELGACARRSFFVFPAGEAGEALLFEDQRDGGWTELVSSIFKGPADIVDGEVVLSQGDDLFSDFVHLG